MKQKIKHTKDLVCLRIEDANQFRLGNLVYYEIIDEGWDENNRFVELCKVAYDDFSSLDGCGICYYAIPLTEEWLLKFGFLLIRRADYVNFDFDEWKLKDFELEDFIYRGSVEVELKYVHQLQNLYFALTGEELTIKNPTH